MSEACYICLSESTKNHKLVSPCANSNCTMKVHRDCLFNQRQHKYTKCVCKHDLVMNIKINYKKCLITNLFFAYQAFIFMIILCACPLTFGNDLFIDDLTSNKTHLNISSVEFRFLTYIVNFIWISYLFIETTCIRDSSLISYINRFDILTAIPFLIYGFIMLIHTIGYSMSCLLDDDHASYPSSKTFIYGTMTILSVSALIYIIPKFHQHFKMILFYFYKFLTILCVMILSVVLPLGTDIFEPIREEYIIIMILLYLLAGFILFLSENITHVLEFNILLTIPGLFIAIMIIHILGYTGWNIANFFNKTAANHIEFPSSATFGYGSEIIVIGILMMIMSAVMIDNFNDYMVETYGEIEYE